MERNILYGRISVILILSLDSLGLFPLLSLLWIRFDYLTCLCSLPAAPAPFVAGGTSGSSVLWETAKQQSSNLVGQRWLVFSPNWNCSDKLWDYDNQGRLSEIFSIRAFILNSPFDSFFSARLVAMLMRFSACNRYAMDVVGFTEDVWA